MQLKLPQSETIVGVKALGAGIYIYAMRKDKADLGFWYKLFISKGDFYFSAEEISYINRASFSCI